MQSRRVYAHYILGLSKTEIARAEGVHEKTVRTSIERGLRNMEILKKIVYETARFYPFILMAIEMGNYLGPTWPEVL